MEACKDHSGVCQNIDNLKENCATHRGDFDKKLDKITNEINTLRNLVITTVIGIAVQLFFYALNNMPKLLAACK